MPRGFLCTLTLHFHHYPCRTIACIHQPPTSRFPPQIHKNQKTIKAAPEQFAVKSPEALSLHGCMLRQVVPKSVASSNECCLQNGLIRSHTSHQLKRLQGSWLPSCLNRCAESLDHHPATPYLGLPGFTSFQNGAPFWLSADA